VALRQNGPPEVRGDVATLGEVDTVAADLGHNVLAEHNDLLEFFKF
jgi:hypothetical protein